MRQLAPWIAPLTAVVFGGGVVMVLWFALRRRGRKAVSVAEPSGALQMPCSVCQKEMVLHRNGLAALPGSECALIARTMPKTVGKKLGEHICPYCESSHYFLIDGKDLVWLGANLYSPQASTTLCMECRRPLQRPPWTAGAYDGRLQEAPSLAPDYGLVCDRCKAVCCVECCTKATRNRTKNGTYHCPRCGRADVKALFHP